MPLKDEHINLLKKPFGSLIKQEDISKENIFYFIKDSKMIITVGDATTEKILSFDLMPNLAIIDGIERRIKKSELEMANLKNTYLTIKKILFEKEQAIIFIDGEEDLLALPVFALAPLDSIVFYGQPLEGIVMVKINDEIKKKSSNLIKSI